jgi:hypothetical protein
MSGSPTDDHPTSGSPESSSPALLQCALTYAQRGWHVFPCHTPRFFTHRVKCSCRDPACTSIGKHPRTTHGFKDATTDAATIRAWWGRWPDANIGIATGARSSLVVLDEDPKRGGDLSALEQHFGSLPETLEAITGSPGRHLYFAYPGTYLPSRRDAFGPQFSGLDIRADGGYVIAPPSLHPSGRRYTWEVCHEPEDIEPASLPAYILSQSQTTTLPTHPAETSKNHIPKAVYLLASVAEGQLSFPYAGPVTQADLLVLLRRWDAVERCLPLLGLAAVRLQQKFYCVVHPDQRASAALYPPRQGHAEDTYVYLDFHGADREGWPLPVIYWALKTGQAPRLLPKSTLVTWTVRMFIEAGVLTPASVRAPKLPEHAPAFVRPIYDGFVRLLQCKWRIEETRSPYTWGFAVDWTRTLTYEASKATVGQAIKWLLSRGFMILAGLDHDLQCFLFGSRALRQRLSQGVGEIVKRTQRAIVDAVQPVVEAVVMEGDHQWMGGDLVRFCRRCNVHHDSCQCLFCVESRGSSP